MRQLKSDVKKTGLSFVTSFAAYDGTIFAKEVPPEAFIQFLVAVQSDVKRFDLIIFTLWGLGAKELRIEWGKIIYSALKKTSGPKKTPCFEFSLNMYAFDWSCLTVIWQKEDSLKISEIPDFLGSIDKKRSSRLADFGR